MSDDKLHNDNKTEILNGNGKNLNKTNNFFINKKNEFLEFMVTDEVYFADLEYINMTSCLLWNLVFAKFPVL